MVFELMSNGLLAALPEASLPVGLPDVSGPQVTLLLPYNRCLLGHSSLEGCDQWLWGKPGGVFEDLSLFDGQSVTLELDEVTQIILSGAVVTCIRSALLSQTPPPGDHLSTVLILRGMLRSHPAFKDGAPFQDEEAFMALVENDELLRKCYWVVRFALFRGEFETITRIRTWLRAGPGSFDVQSHENRPRMWFSLLALPKEADIQELEALNFSLDDLQHMTSQNTVPLLLFNPRSGYLALSSMGEGEGGSFRVWAFIPPGLWGELREKRKLSINELLLAVWGNQDIAAALEMRERYAPSGAAVSPQEA
ncbi:MAG: hypothetical protein GX256_09405 [Fretibacterium sp.]|nr:hypothetical protein [Fretibacterium sp.]